MAKKFKHPLKVGDSCTSGGYVGCKVIDVKEEVSYKYLIEYADATRGWNDDRWVLPTATKKKRKK